MNNLPLERLQNLRIDAQAQSRRLLASVESRGTNNLTSAETKKFQELRATIAELDQQIEDVKFDNARRGDENVLQHYGHSGHSRGSGWAQQAVDALGVTEKRAISSGSVDVPNLVVPTVTAMARPQRLIDLLINRGTLPGNAFEFFKQVARTTNATAVADGDTKPTSTYTVTPVTDRARVVAHLSEEIPIRLWQDAAEVVQFLELEMVQGVLDALEHQVISGDGTGENFTGLLHQSGTTSVAFNTDVPTTLRKARTALETLGVTNGLSWVLSPADAEAIDLARYNIAFDPAHATTSAQGFLLDGYSNGNANSANIFGEYPRLVSPSMPTGTAVLADWSMLKLFVREEMQLLVDASGELFTKNQAIMRAELRAGIGLLRPASFAIIDLTA